MSNTENTRRLLLLKDEARDYPDLWCRVYIAAYGSEKGMFSELFGRVRCKKADTPEEADLVIFGGGVDVDPVLYGETKHSSVHIDPERDTADLALYKKCLDLGIPMIGVCRGAQFLHVMNGGKLFQDVNHHYGEHSMYDIHGKQNIESVSSVHHQMCRPNLANGMDIVAESHISTKRWYNQEKFDTGNKKDIEAFFYRDTCCFGVQGHPEYSGYPKFTKWFLEKIENLIIHNPDIKWNGNNLRINPDILGLREQERKAKTAATQAVAN